MSNQPQKSPIRRTDATKELEQYVLQFKQWYINENRTLEEVGRLFKELLGVDKDIGTWKSRRRQWGLLKSKSAGPSRSVSTSREPEVQQSRESFEPYLETFNPDDESRGVVYGSSFTLHNGFHPPMIDPSFNSAVEQDMTFALGRNDYSQTHITSTASPQTTPNIAMPFGNHTFTLPLRTQDPSTQHGPQLHMYTSELFEQPQSNSSEVHHQSANSGWVFGHGQMRDHSLDATTSYQEFGSPDIDGLEDGRKWIGASPR